MRAFFFNFMIIFKKVTKNYQTKTVLRDINLEFEPNKTHVFIGSSGSGKTTLLKLLAGLIEPTEGSISINGEILITNQNYLNKLGYVIQEGGLFPHLTCKQNILLAIKNLNFKKDYTETKIKELTELVHLEPYILDKYPTQLSGGQRQRVGLMRALIREPEIILMDEPLGALDPIVRADLQIELKEIFNKLKKTVFFVTHDMNEGAFFGHTITLLDQGQVIQHGAFTELSRNPKSEFVTKFIRSQLSHDLVQELRDS